MGYDSRVYAMRRFEFEGHAFGFETARFEVFSWPYSGVVEEWRDLFAVPADFKMYDDSDGEIKTDCYGEKCRAADVETVRGWLRGFLAEAGNGDYMRARAFLAWLDAVSGAEWADG